MGRDVESRAPSREAGEHDHPGSYQGVCGKGKTEGGKAIMATVRKRRGEWVIDYYDANKQRHIFQVDSQEDGFKN